MTKENIQKLQDALREVRERYHALILQEIKTSSATYREIAAEFGCSEGLVYTISRLNGISRARQGLVNADYHERSVEDSDD